MPEFLQSHEESKADSICCGVEKYDYRLPTPHKAGSSINSSNTALSRLSDKCSAIVKIRKNYDDIARAFHNFDSHHTGKILRSQLKKILRIYCFYISDQEFDGLLEGCEVDARGKVKYILFLDKVTGLDYEKSKGYTSRSGIPQCATVDELEIMLQSKIKKNLTNVVNGFILFDYANDGFVQKKEFRKVLENYCFKFSDEQFNNLWKRYDNAKRGIVCYENFLVKLGANVDRCQKYITKETLNNATCWSNKSVIESDNNTKMIELRKKAAIEFDNDPCIKGKSLDDTVKLFLMKLNTPGMGKLICQSCRMFDPKNTGFMSLTDLHGVFNHLVMPMSWQLFLQIIYNCTPVGGTYKKICWNAFLQKYCQKKTVDFPIYKAHRVEENKKAHDVVDKIKRNVLNPKDRIGNALTTFDHNGRHVFTRTELKRVLHKMNFFLTEEEFRDLFSLLDPTHSNFISSTEFLSVFGYPETKPCDVDPPGGVKSKLNPCILPNYRDTERCVKKKEKVDCAKSDSLPSKSASLNGCEANVDQADDCSSAQSTQSKGDLVKGFPCLHWANLKNKFRYYFNKNYDHIARSLRAADSVNSGKVHIRILNEILNNYIFPLTKDQFGEIMDDFVTFRDEIYYNLFLDYYHKFFSEKVETWMYNVRRVMDDKRLAVKPANQCDIEEYISDAVRAKRNALLTDFTIIDTAKLGAIRRADFRRLLDKHILRLNDEQFCRLWLCVPKNDCGRVLYVDFLTQYMCLSPC